MIDFMTVLTIICGLITLVTFVATSVWVVANVKETTSNLAIEIRNLGKAVDKINVDFGEMDKRLRLIEAKQ